LIRAQSLHLSTSDHVGIDNQGLHADEDVEMIISDIHHDVGPKPLGIDYTTQIFKSQTLFETFNRLLHTQRAHWYALVGIVVSAMAVAAATPIQAWLFARVLGIFLLSTEAAKSRANFWALMWLALAVGSGLANLCEGWIGLRVQYSVSAVYKTQYFTDMLYQRISFFDKDVNSHGTLSSRIASDAKSLEEVFGLNLGLALSGMFNVVGCIIISLIFSWKLGLVALCVTMPIMLSSGFWKYRHEVQFDKMNSSVFAESSQFATEAIGAIRTVSALTMENTITERYSKLLAEHVQAAHVKALWTSGLYGFVDSAGLGCQALIFWYGGRLLARGEYSFEAFFVCYMAMIQGAEAASQVLSVAPNTAQATAAANRIFEIQESADIQRAGPNNDIKNIPDADGGVRVGLRNVRFNYPTRDISVFEDLNITIEKGQYAAFVGPSGCGKTTIISLLERFYDINPGQGAITCNGININEMNVYDYRRHLSLVAQEPTMFRGTVRDNVLFGIPDPGSVPEERIHQVCRDALIHDFIMSLPQGYDTDVGAKGTAMSGGQRQRIAIARALIRDPKLLLLDEATSALDSESEKIVQAAFERARSGRTMIAVAHRLSTIQTADVIFVFDDGKVVEKGSHAELVKKQGVYWEMVSFVIQSPCDDANDPTVVPKPSSQLSHIFVLVHSSASNDSDAELGVIGFLLILHDSVLNLLTLLSLRPFVVTCDLVVESSLSLLDIGRAYMISVVIGHLGRLKVFTVMTIHFRKKVSRSRREEKEESMERRGQDSEGASSTDLDFATSACAFFIPDNHETNTTHIDFLSLDLDYVRICIGFRMSVST
jgi:ATP-binding cassette subfamily B (MDR/TAP) protein 1